ncbi:MAG: hypothetical protein M0Q51_11805 [Bacteroidales bacterium]|nr:hypothetical protein [Bacteroidales bacterium]
MKKSTTNEIDFVQLYSLENYLFDVVNSRFQKEGYLNAFDLFCVIIWKANRSKSTIAKRLLKKEHKSLEEACKELTSQIHQAPTEKEKMKVLMDEWGFLLPMSTAILTVLYPDSFTVYDTRVCQMLGKYHTLKDISNLDKLWETYQEFIKDVKKATPGIKSLRDKDRFLWGKSFHDQLKKDIEKQFS